MPPDGTASAVVRVAVLGTGSLGRHHARNLAALDGVELVAVADPDAEQGRAVAAANDCDWVAGHDDLPGNLDAVVIAAPTSLHFELAEWALERGFHCLVEKPMCASLEQARSLHERAVASGRVVQVGHIERFNPVFDHVDVAGLAPGVIVAERVGPHPGRSLDSSVVFDLMIHDIDLALWFAASPVASVAAIGGVDVGPRTDWAEARLEFDNGCVARLVASRVSKRAGRVSFIAGRQSMEIDYRTRTATTFHAAPAKPTRATGSDEEPLRRELSHFVSCIRNGSQPLVTSADGLSAIDVADRVERAIA